MIEKVINLSKIILMNHLDRILEIDRETKGERWDQTNFSLDLPNKWTVSKGIIDNGELIGFLIASQKQNKIHVHRLVIAPDQKGKGWGKILLETVINYTKQMDLCEISLKVDQGNTLAIQFYLKMNFRVVKKEATNLCMAYKITNHLC